MRHPSAAVHKHVLILAPDRVEIRQGARVDSFAKLEGGLGLVIGEFCHVASFCHVNVGGGFVMLEDGATMSSGAKIIGGTNDVDSVSCSVVAEGGRKITRSRTTLGRNACLYAGAILLPGLRVGEGARVGAGSVVTMDVPPFEVWAGNPARFVRSLR